MNTVPFFVADRPMSLRLLKGLPLQKHPDAQIGIMAHANTSQSFQHAFNKYPCEDPNFCDAIGKPCTHKNNIDECDMRKHILEHTIKMCDSGIFTREGATLSYEQLFEAYDRMGVKYGIIIDVFRDPEGTLESAKKGMIAYQIFKAKIAVSNPKKEIFELVAVAQGQTVDQYLQSYEDLRNLGYAYIAVGGLLHKLENTVRFAKVRNEEVMDDVLTKLRERYPEDWLFALGCFHPNRLDKFRRLYIWGDYKGWIFQYEKRNETLNEQLKIFSTLILEKQIDMDVSLLELQSIIKERDEQKRSYEETSQQLNHDRKVLKDSLQALRKILQTEEPALVQQLDECLSHGLLTKETERFVYEAIKKVSREQTEIDTFRTTLHQSRELKAKLAHQETLLNNINDKIVQQFTLLDMHSFDTHQKLKELYYSIKGIIIGTEREHRFSLVRQKMDESILSRL